MCVVCMVEVWQCTTVLLCSKVVVLCTVYSSIHSIPALVTTVVASVVDKSCLTAERYLVLVQIRHEVCCFKVTVPVPGTPYQDDCWTAASTTSAGSIVNNYHYRARTRIRVPIGLFISLRCLNVVRCAAVGG